MGSSPSPGSTGFREIMQRCPSRKPGGAGLSDAMQAVANKKRPAKIRYFCNSSNLSKNLGGIATHYPAHHKGRIYGKVNCQALRPWVAAYSLRAPGTIVRPATSTIGSPVPATSQSGEPFGNLSTPQSFET